MTGSLHEDILMAADSNWIAFSYHIEMTDFTLSAFALVKKKKTAI